MIIYLHGFRSSKRSLKARQLSDYLSIHAPAESLWCEDLNCSPTLAIQQIEDAIHRCSQKPLLVGSSLGGYYATYLAELHDLKAVLINPACEAADLLAPCVGPQRNIYTGEVFELTQEHIDDLRRIHVHKLTLPERFWVLLETDDEVLDYRQAIKFYRGARFSVIEGGNHGFESFPEFLPEILSLSTAEAGQGPTSHNECDAGDIPIDGA